MASLARQERNFDAIMAFLRARRKWEEEEKIVGSWVRIRARALMIRCKGWEDLVDEDVMEELKEGERRQRIQGDWMAVIIDAAAQGEWVTEWRTEDQL